MSSKEDIKQLQEDVKSIKENHLPHIQSELAVFRTKIEWIEKLIWTAVTSAVGSVVVGIINLIK